MRDMFFMDSKGDVSRVFQACVLHASKAMCRDRHVFFMGFTGEVPRVFQACVLHASGTNPAAVRGFRRRFSKAMCREKHVFYGFQR